MHAVELSNSDKSEVVLHSKKLLTWAFELCITKHCVERQLVNLMRVYTHSFSIQYAINHYTHLSIPSIMCGLLDVESCCAVNFTAEFHYRNSKIRNLKFYTIRVIPIGECRTYFSSVKKSKPTSLIAVN